MPPALAALCCGRPGRFQLLESAGARSRPPCREVPTHAERSVPAGLHIRLACVACRSCRRLRCALFPRQLRAHQAASLSMPRARDAVTRGQLASVVGKGLRAPAHVRRIANIVPTAVRSLPSLVEDRGHAPERLCKGLGFTDRDLHHRDLLLSYRQVRALILRARRLLDEPAMGLAAGMRQGPVSWGLTGLAMLTCETFGEAIAYGLGHQHEVGAMMQHLFAQHGPEASIELVPHVFDLEIEPYLIEEAFAGALNVSRCMLGPDIRQRAVELTFAQAAPVEAYTRFFRCAVRFDAGRNRMTLDAKWLAARLPGYDRTTCGLWRHQLETLIQRSPSRNDLVESIALRLRSDAGRAPRQPELARQAIAARARCGVGSARSRSATGRCAMPPATNVRRICCAIGR